jgi:acyl carrier protein
MNDIKKNIKDFIVETTFSDPNDIDYNTLIFEEGIFDSMGMLSLIEYIDEKHEISVGDVELTEDNFGNINRIAQYINNKKM